MARVLRRLDGPVVALRAVQLSQEQVVLRASLGKAAEYVLGGVEAVVNERFAPMPARVIPREEDGIRMRLRARLQVVVDRLNKGDRGEGVALQGKVGVNDVGVAGHVRRESGGVGELARRNL